MAWTVFAPGRKRRPLTTHFFFGVNALSSAQFDEVFSEQPFSRAHVTFLFAGQASPFAFGGSESERAEQSFDFVFFRVLLELLKNRVKGTVPPF